MAYIDTKYLGKCETCRHDISGKCDVWCENGEFYSPNLSKIPTADVVEVVRCKDCAYRYTKYCNAKHERADMDYCSSGDEK